ncbi:MAG: DUF393 domain-containing protein [Planctomyces sp.]|nr:DUF393 domain-containing protein [Planctomyces sp.]
MPIVFFDGVCGFCNHTVNFLLKRDKHRRLRFAPLQGETASQCVPAEIRSNLSSLVLHRDGKVYLRSAAVVRILFIIGGVWSILGALLWIIPLPLRDLGYKLFARYRYTLFGKHDACRLPTPEERTVFLD